MQPPTEVLEEARRRTYAAGSARIEIVTEHRWKIPPMPQRRRGGLLRPLAKLGKATAKRVWRVAIRRHDLSRRTAEGVLDLVGRRSMLDHGSFAELHADGHQWSGRSGRAISTLPADGVPGQYRSPIWLLDILSGVVSTEDHGNALIRGVTCRHLTATIDLSRASELTPGGVGVPSRKRFEELLALTADVWLDDSHIRRVRFTEDEHQTETIDLFDFGVSVHDLDWTRLPTFRSPAEASKVADAQLDDPS